MKSPAPSLYARASGFSLIELMVVMVIIGVLTVVGITSMGNPAATARKTATEQFTAAIEQARTAAITRRKPVILAMVAPVPGDIDQNCRFGLFEVDKLPEEGAVAESRQLQRWTKLPEGVVFFGGKIDDLQNVADEDPVQLTWKDGENHAEVRALAFNSRGGLAWPSGSEPVAVKLGNGTYRDGKPVAITGGGQNSLRIGRVVARPWKLD